MFVSVKYGEDQEALVNSNCKVQNLFRFIRKVSNIPEDVELELCDLNGEIRHLQDNKENYASNFLREKEKYILLRIERRPSESKPTYAPLLNNDQVITEDFLMKLNSIKKNKNFKPERTPKVKNPLPLKNKRPSQTLNINGGSINEQETSPRAQSKNGREYDELK